MWFKLQTPNTVSGWKRGRQRFAPCCSQMCWDGRTLQCFRTKHVHPRASPSRSDVYSSRDHTRFALYLSRLTLTMNARRFQRTHPLSGMGSSLNASKDVGVGVTDFAPIVNQSQCLTWQWLVQLALAYLYQALIARSGLSTRSVLATHDCHSLQKKDDRILHTHPSLLYRVTSQQNLISISKHDDVIKF